MRQPSHNGPTVAHFSQLLSRPARYTSLSSATAFIRAALLLAFIGSIYLLSDNIAPGVAHAAPVIPAIVTYKNGNAHLGENTQETILNTSNVNVNQFGKRIQYAVDGQIHAEPLYVPGITINGSSHNIVIVATEHDDLYAFDADNTNPSVGPLWYTSFINPPAVTTVPSSQVNCQDINPEYGITGTPVIDPTTNTLYVVVNTLENNNNIYRLHAIDITTGLEKHAPALIQPSVKGTGDGSINGVIHFDSTAQLNRGGLILLNGEVYVAFGSHCDNFPYHGWLMGFNSSTLKLNTVYNDTRNGSQGGIWESGDGPAVDSNGYLYFMTGNGSFDLNTGGIDAGDTFEKLSTSSGLHRVNYFTPFNQQCLAQGDTDLGSGGVILLPTDNEMIGAGKEGRIYVVNRSNPGKYNTIPDPCNNQNRTDVDHIVQELPPGTIGGMWSTPAYWNGSNGQFVYFSGANDHIKAFQFANGKLSISPTSQSPESLSYPGTNTFISSNGTTAGTGILWAIDHASVLRAYDATNLNNELYNSNQNASRDGFTGAIKFTVPTVANGEVFVGTSTNLVIFGLLP